MDETVLDNFDEHLGMTPFELRDRIVRIFNSEEDRKLITVGHVNFMYWVAGRRFNVGASAGRNLEQAFFMTWGPYDGFVKTANFDLIKHDILPALARLLVLDDLAEV